MELWNNVCEIVREYKFKNIPESKVEELWMTVFMELGWSKIKGELISQMEIPIGANNKLIPDILLKVQNENVLVVELKRPNQELIDKHSTQLISYMLQTKMKIGLLICSDLQIFYDNPAKNNSPQKLLSIDFRDNNPEGVKLFELLKRSEFSKESLNQYCLDLLEEQDDIEKAKVIADKITNGDDVISDFKELLTKKYGQRITKHLFDYLSIKIEKKVVHKHDDIAKPKTEKEIIDGPIPGTPENEKIGAKAKRLFGDYILNEKFSLTEIKSLCDPRYSKLNFGTGYPILKEITNEFFDDIRFDHKGRARYWKEVFYGYGKKFYISSQWYETQASYLESYFNRININSETNILKK